MIPTLLFVAFLFMMMMGVPIGASLGLAGAACIALANSDAQWFGLLAVPQNFYAGLGKYPLLAIPMFILVGSIFDRSGVALRLVNFAIAIVGRGPGMLPLVAILVAKQAMEANNYEKKGSAISKAVLLIDSGLRGGLNIKDGGELAESLNALYSYMCQQLMQGSLKNQPALLNEVYQLLGDLKSAWDSIGRTGQNSSTPATIENPVNP